MFLSSTRFILSYTFMALCLCETGDDSCDPCWLYLLTIIDIWLSLCTTSYSGSGYGTYSLGPMDNLVKVWLLFLRRLVSAYVCCVSFKWRSVSFSSMSNSLDNSSYTYCFDFFLFLLPFTGETSIKYLLELSSVMFIGRSSSYTDESSAPNY